MSAHPAPNPSLPLTRLSRSLFFSSSDNARGFFEACFPALLRNVFGLEGTSWLSAAARVSFFAQWMARGTARNSLSLSHAPSHSLPLPTPSQPGRASDATALLRLFSPAGPLMVAVADADAERAVRCCVAAFPLC